MTTAQDKNYNNGTAHWMARRDHRLWRWATTTSVNMNCRYESVCVRRYGYIVSVGFARWSALDDGATATRR